MSVTITIVFPPVWNKQDLWLSSLRSIGQQTVQPTKLLIVPSEADHLELEKICKELLPRTDYQIIRYDKPFPETHAFWLARPYINTSHIWIMDSDVILDLNMVKFYLQVLGKDPYQFLVANRISQQKPGGPFNHSHGQGCGSVMVLPLNIYDQIGGANPFLIKSGFGWDPNLMQKWEYHTKIPRRFLFAPVCYHPYHPTNYREEIANECYEILCNSHYNPETKIWRYKNLQWVPETLSFKEIE